MCRNDNPFWCGGDQGKADSSAPDGRLKNDTSTLFLASTRRPRVSRFARNGGPWNAPGGLFLLRLISAWRLGSWSSFVCGLTQYFRRANIAHRRFSIFDLLISCDLWLLILFSIFPSTSSGSPTIFDFRWLQGAEVAQSVEHGTENPISAVSPTPTEQRTCPKRLIFQCVPALWLLW